MQCVNCGNEIVNKHCHSCATHGVYDAYKDSRIAELEALLAARTNERDQVAFERDKYAKQIAAMNLGDRWCIFNVAEQRVAKGVVACSKIYIEAISKDKVFLERIVSLMDDKNMEVRRYTAITEAPVTR